MPLSPGTHLGRYEIVSPLGAGGMGEVYRARDTRLGRSVAIKILLGGLARDEELRARFHREAEAIAALKHPHICVLYDVGESDGADYLVMEHLEGETLAQRLQRGPLPLEKTIEHGVEIASALAAAHRHGFVHRDLKPGNVMLTPTGAKVLDFGLAKPMARERAIANSADATAMMPLTVEGTIAGTLGYMAPEQLEGRPADARSDLFAMGAMLFEMVTGKKAFEASSQAGLIAAVLSSAPDASALDTAQTPPLLRKVILKCLAKNPEQRWQDAADLLEALRWVGDVSTREGAPGAAPAPVSESSRQGWSYRMAAAAAGALALILAGCSPGRFRGRATCPRLRSPARSASRSCRRRERRSRPATAPVALNTRSHPTARGWCSSPIAEESALSSGCAPSPRVARCRLPGRRTPSRPSGHLTVGASASSRRASCGR